MGYVNSYVQNYLNYIYNNEIYMYDNKLLSKHEIKLHSIAIIPKNPIKVSFFTQGQPS